MKHRLGETELSLSWSSFKLTYWPLSVRVANTEFKPKASTTPPRAVKGYHFRFKISGLIA